MTRSPKPTQQIAASERIAAVITRASEPGLHNAKNSRIAGRESPRLFEQARAQTELLSARRLRVALANIAVEDAFAETFQAVRGAIDPDLQREF